MKKTLLFAALAALTMGVMFGASLKIVSPNGGETDVCMGKTYAIQWTAAGVSQKVKLVLFKNDTKVDTIKENLAAGSSPYNWMVGTPGQAGSGYTVRVRTMDNSMDDFSDNPFEIKATCDDGGGTIDPGILEKIRRMKRIAIKWPPDPDPCMCPEFDIRELRDILGNHTGLVKIHLLKNGILVQELGIFRRGAILPASLKGKLNAADYRLLRLGGAKFSLALIGENGKIMNEIALPEAPIAIQGEQIR
jgi:hypothetical protein